MRASFRSAASPLAHDDSGALPTLLLLHGFPLSRATWSHQVESLCTHARVIAPDLPGFGDTPAGQGPFDMGRYAGACAELLEHLGVAMPVIVVGHSMGGYVALELFRRHPERVAGMMLVSTRAGADGPPARAARDAAAEDVRRQGVGVLVNNMLPKLLATSTAQAHPARVEAVRASIEAASREGAVGALAAMRDRPDSTATLGAIRVPVSIVHGTDDALIPPSEAEAMHAALRDSELVLLEGVAHLPQMEQPGEFDAAVVRLLERVRQAVSR